MRISKVLFLFLLFAVTSCSTDVWSNPALWYVSEKPSDGGYADVFYLISTNIIHEQDAAGNVLYRSLNTRQELETFSREMSYTESVIFPDSLNFFSPYYHQYTLDAIHLSPEEFGELASDVADEVYDAFRYYLKHFNGGRPVVLAGFSQGAQLVKELLKRMTPEEYSQIAAAYMLGWGLNVEDTECDRIVPAERADDTGVCISFNSVSDTSAIWDAVMDGAAYSINPVNWCRDTTSAAFEYGGQNLTVQLDTSAMVLKVDGFTEHKTSFPPVWPKGCLHSYEIRFYNPFLNVNALRRVNCFRQSAGSGGQAIF